MPNNNDNYEYMKFLDLTGVEQIWNTCKQTFVQTVNGVGIDANGNVNTSGVNFPVGYIYLTTDNSTSPASLFGGTWERIKDKFLLGAGDTYTAGDTGGNATHTHNAGTIQPLITNYAGKIIGQKSSTGTTSYRANIELGITSETEIGSDVITTLFNSVGATDSANGLPPYLVVYIWKRTA